MRKQKQLEAIINTLRSQLVTRQKEHLQLENKLHEKARDYISLTDRYAQEKDRRSKLQLIAETQEKSIWRMASQIEVGSPFSHLGKHATQPVINELRKRLEQVTKEWSDSQTQANAALAQVEGLELKSSMEKKRADELDETNKKMQVELKEIHQKWQIKMDAAIQEITERKDAIIATLTQTIETTKAENDANKILLAAEKKLSEDTIHQLSETELALSEATTRVEELTDRLASAAADAKKEYKDVVARLDEAVSRNEAREDTFSSHWTASNFRTAVSAGDAAAREKSF